MTPTRLMALSSIVLLGTAIAAYLLKDPEALGLSIFFFCVAIAGWLVTKEQNHI